MPKYDVFHNEIIMPKKARVLGGKDIIVIASSSYDLDATIKNQDMDEYMLQSFQYQYNMPNAVFKELGTGNKYTASGDPAGSLTLTKIIGVKPITDLLSDAILDSRYPGGLIIIKPTQAFYNSTYIDENGEEQKMVIDYNLFFYGCKAEALSGGGDASSPVIQESVSIRFSYLEALRIST